MPQTKSVLIEEKLKQAAAILCEKGIDAWLTFCRETSEINEPALKLIAGTSVTWDSAFLLGAGGDRGCVVGRLDVNALKALGNYPEVIGYDESLRGHLVRLLDALNPKTLAINYSESNTAADGLTHGMYLKLLGLLEGTPYVGRLVSAEDVVAALRGRKSAEELRRITAAVQTTELIIDEFTAYLRPGRTEVQMQAFVQERMRAHGVGPSWDAAYCPTMTAGPSSPAGHVGPTETVIESGQTLAIDVGVKQDDYCSDIQRTWYLARPGETRPPEPVARAFAAVRGAIEAGEKALRPGVEGWVVDAAARQALVGAGYPEFKHALGHQLGLSAHDGSGLLGPRWERYGRTPHALVEEGQVYTLELEVATEVGPVTLEEDVVVTRDGCEYLSRPQTEVLMVRT
ncbi:MAG: M24 family metallopeptidase [Bacillota bacterium]